MISKDIKNKSFSLGAIEFVRKYYKKLELGSIFEKYKLKGVPISGLIRGYLSGRFQGKKSVPKISGWLNQYHIKNRFDLPNFHEKTMYRILECIGHNHFMILPEIQRTLFSKYNFLDTDSVIDWSTIIVYGDKSPLAARGHSKQRRKDKKQITFGVSELKYPICVPYYLSIQKGNIVDKTHFKKTFLGSIKYLKKRSLIIIDRGANTKQNRELIIEHKLNYLTARILSNQDMIYISQFDRKTAKRINPREKNEVYCQKIVLRDKIIVQRNNKKKRKPLYLYVCFSPELEQNTLTKKYKKVEKKLAEAIELEKKISSGKKIKSFVKKTLNSLLITKVTIQKTLVKKTRDDLKKELLTKEVNGREGFFILKSSKNLTEKEAVTFYRQKDYVEKLINSLKNHIKIQPLQVWTTSSIIGSLILDFLVQIFVSLAKYEHEKLLSFSTKTIISQIKNLTLTLNFAKNSIVEQIISNFDDLSLLIFPDLYKKPG